MRNAIFYVSLIVVSLFSPHVYSSETTISSNTAIGDEEYKAIRSQTLHSESKNTSSNSSEISPDEQKGPEAVSKENLNKAEVERQIFQSEAETTSSENSSQDDNSVVQEDNQRSSETHGNNVIDPKAITEYQNRMIFIEETDHLVKKSYKFFKGRKGKEFKRSNIYKYLGRRDLVKRYRKRMTVKWLVFGTLTFGLQGLGYWLLFKSINDDSTGGMIGGALVAASGGLFGLGLIHFDPNPLLDYQIAELAIKYNRELRSELNLQSKNHKINRNVVGLRVTPSVFNYGASINLLGTF